MHHRLVAAASAVAVCLAPPLARAAAFDFANASAGSTPLTVAIPGNTATFSSAADPGAFIVNLSNFATLGTTVLQSPGLGPVELDVAFSAPVASVRFAFATEDFLVDPTAITATFMDGLATVGSETVTGAAQAASGFPEGVIEFAGGPITGFTLTDADAPGIAIGAVGVPEPPAAALLGIALLGMALGGLAHVRRRAAGARA